ncbi:MAG: hypothetical protein Q7R43_01635 [Candidatus Daviesbacteria bacterium]|nr:hypothetical protein [Candidatus Daviesbacteria bacterium]
MIKKLSNNNLLILLILLLIGLTVHFKSFQMVPYGDDWTFIYDYISHNHKPAHVNTNYPGLFSFLTPYGPSVLTIGLVHQFFGNAYYIYYLIPLMLKILISFFLFLILQNISLGLKKNNSLTNFSSAVLFLVGFTGIQAIDWSMNMNVYIALFIFTLGLFFQSKYYLDKRNLYLFTSTFLFLLSIVVAPTRFTPFVLIIPLIDIVLFAKGGYSLFRILLIKNIFFTIAIYLFFKIGIFGQESGQITNISLIYPFIQVFLTNPIWVSQLFMHWIGITIFPIYPAADIHLTALSGALFIMLLIVAFYKSLEKWLVVGLILYFIPLFLMFLSSRLHVEDSVGRHLLIPFFSLCFLIGVILMLKIKLINILKFSVLILILMHIYFVNKVYSNWISIGRGSDFIIPVQEQIMSHFPSPINSPKIIYLDFDDGAIQQSIVFGLAYRVAVLSETKSMTFFPKLIDNKTNLIDLIKKNDNKDEESIIEGISAFQYKNKVFTDITSVLQEELRKEIQ